MTEPQTAERMFTCARCGGTFAKDWSDEEALAEKDRDYPGFAIDECAEICDPCYQEYQKWAVKNL